jgi:hypothetical protein
MGSSASSTQAMSTSWRKVSMLVSVLLCPWLPTEGLRFGEFAGLRRVALTCHRREHFVGVFPLFFLA